MGVNEVLERNQLSGFQISKAALAVVVIFLIAFQEGALPAMLPVVLKDLKLAAGDAGWIASANAIFGALAIPIIGWLGDRFSKGWVFVSVVMVVCIGSVVCGVSTNLTSFLIGQTLFGISLALHPLAIGVMAETFPRSRMALGNGLVIGTFVIGTMTGLLLAGTVITHFGFSNIFFIPLPLIVLASFALGWVTYHHKTSRESGHSLDIWGVMLLAMVSVAMMVGLGTGPMMGYTTPLPLTCLAIAFASTVSWVLVEFKQQSPVFDVRLFMRIDFCMICVVNVASGVASVGVAILVPLVLQANNLTSGDLGSKATQTGVFILPMGVFAMLSAFANHGVRKWIGKKFTVIFGAASLWLSMFLLTIEHASIWQMLVAIAFCGIGMGLANTEVANTVVESVGPEKAASATGFMYILRNIGSIAAAQVVGGILRISTDHATGVPSATGFGRAFSVCAILTGVGLFAALFIRSSRSTLKYSGNQG
ncbi:MFS transporter [Burkholderia anthina]|uniref:MFS transporter n=1 Tax=Burkholderia anthina TaxID=179879 RepID=UPI00158EB0AE|nr:MFS transporter [Burkholderia anthina]